MNFGNGENLVGMVEKVRTEGVYVEMVEWVW